MLLPNITKSFILLDINFIFLFNYFLFVLSLSPIVWYLQWAKTIYTKLPVNFTKRLPLAIIPICSKLTIYPLHTTTYVLLPNQLRKLRWLLWSSPLRFSCVNRVIETSLTFSTLRFITKDATFQYRRNVWDCQRCFKYAVDIRKSY